jgi:hypothetical protein
MQKSTLFVVLLSAASGLLCGHLGKKSNVAAAVTVAPASSLPADRTPLLGNSQPTTGEEISYPRSSDTPETLLAGGAAPSYARIAAWLADATESEISKFWQAYRGNHYYSEEITNLIFIQWTRLDAPAALAAAGEYDDIFAWRGWASHAPQAALAAAITAGDSAVNAVAQAIGEFQPAWLRANLDQIPESARQAAIEGLRNSTETADPLAALKFMRENHMSFDPSTFKALVQKDPWAALDWVIENPALQKKDYSGDSSALDLLLDSMSRQQPTDLQRLAEQTPPGQLKRQMEAALFAQLLTTAPAAALAQARATEAPLMAADRLARVGMTLVKSDPAQAFQIAKEILERNPRSLRAETEIQHKNGTMCWYMSNGIADDFIDSLIHADPVKFFDIAATAGKTATSTSSVFRNLTHKWAGSDLAGYMTWVNQQQDPIIRDDAVHQVVSSLAEKAQFHEATEWVMSTSNSPRSAYWLLSTWKKANPAEAVAWVESTAVPEAMKPAFREIIKQH